VENTVVWRVREESPGASEGSKKDPFVFQAKWKSDLGGRRSDVAQERKDRLARQQLLHRNCRLLRFVAVIASNQMDFAPVDSAMGVDVLEISLDTHLHAAPKFFGGSAKGRRHADADLIRGNAGRRRCQNSYGCISARRRSCAGLPAVSP